MSARDRARLNQLIAIRELYLAYKENGRKIPAWLNYGITDKEKIDGSYALAETALDQIPLLLEYCTPGGADQRTLERAQAGIERFLQGVHAMRQLPKQAPKHRQALLGIWNQAQLEIMAIAECVEVWGMTPEQFLED